MEKQSLIKLTVSWMMFAYYFVIVLFKSNITILLKQQKPKKQFLHTTCGTWLQF